LGTPILTSLSNTHTQLHTNQQTINPQPNLRVGLKKEYNNAAQMGGRAGYGQQQQQRDGAAPKLLSGDMWYGQQAFRALNQVRRGGGGWVLVFSHFTVLLIAE